MVPVKLEEELWDVYTKDRVKTGKTHRRGDKMEKGEYHLVVHVCIFNSKNQLLIQQRQPFKKGWPNMWDVSVGGSAVAGDDSGQAAEREVLEELGLKLDLSEKRPSFTMNFSDGFDDYYIVNKDIDIGNLHLQNAEVKQVKWVGREEALRMQNAGIMVPYWFLDKLFDLGDIHEFDAHGNREGGLTVDFASFENVESWMSLVEIVRDNFPGLETNEGIEEYYQTLIKNIKEERAICTLDGNMVTGILLFSVKYNMIGCLAVHPEYRRKNIASRMIELMLTKLDSNRDISVETFREGDEKGIASRAFYISMGFVPGELTVSLNYPTQRFILKSK